MSDEFIKPTATANYGLTPKFNYFGTKTRVWLNGSCLKQDKITFNYGTIVNIYIVHEKNKNYNTSSDPTLEKRLFGVVSLTKNLLILISINMLGMVLDLIGKDFFSGKWSWLECNLSLAKIWVHLHILIIRKKIFLV